MSSAPQYTTEQEATEAAFGWRDSPLVSYGLPFPLLAVSHVQRLGCHRAFALVSGSVATKTSSYQQLKDGLGSLLVGERVGVKSHTYWDEVLNISLAAQAVQADVIISLGGGSVSDAAKLVSFVLSNDVHTLDDLGALLPIHHGIDPDTQQFKFSLPGHVVSVSIPVIAIPTTLSAGEYMHGAGATDPRNNAKRQFVTPDFSMAPKVVILDPAVTLSTPERTWLSSGVRAIDHATEVLCSFYSTDDADQAAANALPLLVPALLKLKANDFNDRQARLEAQLGARKAIEPICLFIPGGGSHAIGHMLGPLGVGHGETSCILLPYVCKYNSANPSARARQQRPLSLLWSSPEVASALEARGLKRESADLSSTLDGVFRELGMPRTLREVGIDPAEEFLDRLAELSLSDFWMVTNPIPLTEKEEVLKILRMAA